MAAGPEAPFSLFTIIVQRYLDRIRESLRVQPQYARTAIGAPEPETLGGVQPRRVQPRQAQRQARSRQGQPRQAQPGRERSPGSGPVTPQQIPEPVGERHKRGIPQDVKIAVAARDGGRCRQCGSAERLHFDHVIPVSRGGANTVANIQLLCGPCNRSKAAKLVTGTQPVPPAKGSRSGARQPAPESGPSPGGRRRSSPGGTRP
jgi:5-methylcytosine-specific restriction endonuclease McrA